MSGDNLVIRKDGQRECRQCRRDRARDAARRKGIQKRSPADADFESPAPAEGYRPSRKAARKLKV